MVFDGRFKYVDCGEYRPMLFDLKEDPQELRDLGPDPAYEAERARLKALLFDWAMKPRHRVTVTDGMLETVDVQRNITEAGVLIGYYDRDDLEKAAAAWQDRPIFAAFNPVWAKAQKKLRGEDSS